MSKRIVWFSCGAASAVAAKLAVEKYGNGVRVIYCDTMSTEHPDNKRFFDEVQAWIGKPIEVIRSDKYASINDVFEKTRYMAGPAGARCTLEMKKAPREAMQQPDDIHIFGYTFDEQKRAEDFEDREQNRSLQVEWILIDFEVTKERCLELLAAEGIKLPKMYELGFDHNNCLGCVKSQSPGYWNKVRRLFPQVWELRRVQSRCLGVRLATVYRDGKKVRLFLDEVPPDDQTPDDDIDCGPVCQMPLDTQ